MKVWQIAAGDPSRNYAHLFFEHDIMLRGPGNPGHALRPESERRYKAKHPRQWRSIQRFATKIKPGDRIAMRSGSALVGVGIVPEPEPQLVHGYDWDERYEDVHGWDLQHCRRVCWTPVPSNPITAKLFDGRWTMFSRVNNDAVQDQLNGYFEAATLNPPKPLPAEPTPELTEAELGAKLFSHGLSQGSVDALVTSIARQRRMLGWYDEHGEASGRPTEHEVVAYMVLPMLLALGWSEQLLAVEWKSIDLAAFGRTPTTVDDCVLVCEAKRMWSGLQGGAYPQAQGYVKKLKLDCCSTLLVTQGQRFYLYRRQPDGTWPEHPTGYLNLARLRERYTFPAGTGAIDTLMDMTPGRVIGAHP